MDTEYSVSVLKIDGNDNVIEIGINSTNESLWRAGISSNQHSLNPIPIQLTNLENDDIKLASFVNMQIHLKGIPYNIAVGPESDIPSLADDFIAQHRLKADIKPRIEIELLKTQVDACISYQSKIKKNNGNLRRQVCKIGVAETRANMAEKTCYELTDSLSRIQNMIAPLQTIISKLKEENSVLGDTISHQATKLKEYKTYTSDMEYKNRQLKKQLSKMHDERNAIDKEKCNASSLKESKAISYAHIEAEEKSLLSLDSVADKLYSKSIAEMPIKNANDVSDSFEHTSDANIDSLISEKSATALGMKEVAELDVTLMEQVEQGEMEGVDSKDEEALQQVRSPKEMYSSISYAKSIDLEDCKREIEHLKHLIKQGRSLSTKKDVEIRNLKDSVKKLRKKSEPSSGHSSHPTSPVMDEIKFQYDYVKRKLSDVDHQRIEIQTKYDDIASQYETLKRQYKVKEHELENMLRKISESKEKMLQTSVANLQEENLSLKEVIVKLRGEILRLQSHFEEIQRSALSAAQTVAQVQLSSSSSQIADIKNNSDSNILENHAHTSHISDHDKPFEKLALSDLRIETESRDVAHSRDKRNQSDENCSVIVELILEKDDDSEMANGHDEYDVYSSDRVVNEIHVDLALQESIVNLKLNEKSSAALSPVVEDRLLRNVFLYYCQAAPLLTLTK